MRVKQREKIYKQIRQTGKAKVKTAFEYVYAIAYVHKKIYSNFEPETKIKILQKLATQEVPTKLPHHSSYSYKKQREKKHPTKKACWVCGNRGDYHHHIFPLRNGGYDNGVNRIPICHSCHKEIHEWLK